MDKHWQGALSTLNKLLTDAAERLGVARTDVHLAPTADWKWRAWSGTVEALGASPHEALVALCEKVGDEPTEKEDS